MLADDLGLRVRTFGPLLKWSVVLHGGREWVKNHRESLH